MYVQESISETLIKFAKAIKLTVKSGADKHGRDAASSYHYVPGQIRGCIKVVTAWHAVGHPDLPAVPSTDILRTGTSFAGSAKIIKELRYVSHRINKTLETMDKKYYSALGALHKAVMEKYPHVEAFSSIDPLLMEGRAIMFNRQTPKHGDTADPKESWVFLLALGSFSSGGDFYIPALKLRLRYLPGDGIWLRGSALEHEVEAWEGGQRIAIVHFTHQSLWTEHGVKVPPAA